MIKQLAYGSYEHVNYDDRYKIKDRHLSCALSFFFVLYCVCSLHLYIESTCFARNVQCCGYNYINDIILYYIIIHKVASAFGNQTFHIRLYVNFTVRWVVGQAVDRHIMVRLVWAILRRSCCYDDTMRLSSLSLTGKMYTKYI